MTSSLIDKLVSLWCSWNKKEAYSFSSIVEVQQSLVFFLTCGMHSLSMRKAYPSSLLFYFWYMTNKQSRALLSLALEMLLYCHELMWVEIIINAFLLSQDSLELALEETFHKGRVLSPNGNTPRLWLTNGMHWNCWLTLTTSHMEDMITKHNTPKAICHSTSTKY